MLKRTAFHDFHVSAGARMVDYAGWEMPLLYRGIAEEHQQTRQSGSLFDVSHMGRLQVMGADTVRLLEIAMTRGIGQQEVGQCRYSLVCNASGGVLDDVIVYRDTKRWLVVCNAANRQKILHHLTDLRRQHTLDLDISDQTEATAMVALQGPKIIERLAQSLPIDVASLKRYHFQTVSVMLIKFIVSRTGYSGEDGVEVILPARMAGLAVKMLGGRLNDPQATVKPAGLGARDTLRLEAGLPLYGHELAEEIDPLSAGLGWAMDLGKDFVGAQALRATAQQGPARKLVGLELSGRRIARQGAKITADGAIVGQVTSGTLGPTVQKSIAMAYVDTGRSALGTTLGVDAGSEVVSATIVKLPFYVRQQPVSA
jgi:aminomethyltransferase